VFPPDFGRSCAMQRFSVINSWSLTGLGANSRGAEGREDILSERGDDSHIASLDSGLNGYKGPGTRDPLASRC
jgi:hypothetical protein